jgi:hypothetical protein
MTERSKRGDWVKRGRGAGKAQKRRESGKICKKMEGSGKILLSL